MRHTLSALIGVLLIGACLCGTSAAQSGSRWWPLGRSAAEESKPLSDAPDSKTPVPSQAGQQESSNQYAPAEESEQRWMIDSPLAKVSWPRFQLPNMPKPSLAAAQFWPKKSKVDAGRNTWLEPDPGSKSSSPLQSMTTGVRRVADSSRAAWDRTVEVLSPGTDFSRTSSRVARRNTRPPWWKRMFAADDGWPQGPQTVTEWMAQERLDP